jgi:hypothetical protein
MDPGLRRGDGAGNRCVAFFAGGVGLRRMTMVETGKPFLRYSLNQAPLAKTTRMQSSFKPSVQTQKCSFGAGWAEDFAAHV